ncbi:dipeptidase PepV [Streptococcus sp. S784/96/1]|uniref:dipeptidase PepV n=1 Tax=Streptococcus sp. S784/96/1 TaxID=2653499 RepID=UPI001386876D|nr:dipeptidase PepV [Streptococcus sp. S784/96/1]
MTIDWYQEVVSRKEELLADVERLLRIDSVREDDCVTTAYPVGPGPKAALDEFLLMAQENGFSYQSFGPLVAHVDWGEGEELFGLLGHVDVVPAGDGWDSDPFSPTYQEGKLIVRGALDDKGPLVAAFFAMKLLKEMGFEPHKTVRMIVGTDEESEWKCFKYYQTQVKLPKTGFVPDAYFPIVNGEKGNASIVIRFASDTRESSELVLDSFEAGLRENMVPDKAVACISGRGLLILAKDFSDFLQVHPEIQGQAEVEGQNLSLTVHGKSAHGAKPDVGTNAASYLALFLSRYKFNRSSANKWIEFITQILHQDVWGEKLGIAYEDACMGRLTSNLGLATYNDETGGSLTLNIRYPRGVQVSSWSPYLLQKLKEKDAMIQVQVTDNQEPHYVPGNHPLVQTLLKIYHEQTDLPAYERVIGGATYARLMPEGVAFGALFPDAQDTMHQANEYILVDHLLATCAMYAQALYELTCRTY